MDISEKAAKRMAAVLQVQSGMLNATQGAEFLGVSRQSYHAWEERILRGMAAEAEDRPVGRPEKPVDPEVERLQRELSEAQRDIAMLKMAVEIKKVVDRVKAEQASVTSGPAGKKKPSSGRRPLRH